MNKEKDIKTVAFVGNPNVGKSTIFNAVTGLKQHTGNWTGKTVETAVGLYNDGNTVFSCIDLPGSYSLTPSSAEEEVTRDYIYSRKADIIVCVCDATCLERNLTLVLQILKVTKNVIICLNFNNEAEKCGVKIDSAKLSELLNVKTIKINALKKDEISRLVEAVKTFEKKDGCSDIQLNAKEIASACISGEIRPNKRNRKIDLFLTGKHTAIPLMTIFIAIIFWLTLVGSNYPSKLLSEAFGVIKSLLRDFLQNIGLNDAICDLIVSGIFETTATVISVMLPPMAIFFPLFTFLEDIGYLPRIAFNLDRCFSKCGSCGKQALTVCMGFGCNAAAVIGCRIIDSPRERLIAIITNSFVPCNGRFPTLIAIITMFFISDGTFLSSAISALILTAIVLLGIAITFLVSKILSKTMLKGETSSFVLEMPPFRKPQLKNIIVRSLLDRTLKVLTRAVAVAAPTGAVIWLTANTEINGHTLLYYICGFFDPLGQLLGFDGTVLTSFILGLPANEIVMPISAMIYSASGAMVDIGDLTMLKQLLTQNGWTTVTAICFTLFSLFHWPCATTIATVKKEAGLKYAAISVMIPTAIGFILCGTVALFSKILSL